MKAHKKTKLFRHFMTILNMLALAVPMVVLGFHALNDSLPKYFASQSVQHHGGESDVFSDDLDYANEQLKTRSLDDNLMLTMDSMNYMNYDVQSTYTQIEYNYQTNVVNSIDDVINNNIYLLRFRFNADYKGLSYPLVSSRNTLHILDFFYPTGYIMDFEVIRKLPFEYNVDSIVLYPTGNRLFDITYNPDQVLHANTSNLYFTGSYSFYLVCVVLDKSNINFQQYDTYFQFQECPISFIPYTIRQNASTSNISSLDDWKTYYNNKNYAQIIDTGVSTHLPINVDFVSLFTQSDIINHDGNIATLLFINFYCNWILNISLIIFFPQVIMCFINWAIDLIYKFTEVKGD